MWDVSAGESDGIFSDDGEVFICEGGNEDAAKFLEIVGSLGAPHEGLNLERD